MGGAIALLRLILIAEGVEKVWRLLFGYSISDCSSNELRGISNIIILFYAAFPLSKYTWIILYASTSWGGVPEKEKVKWLFHDEPM